MDFTKYVPAYKAAYKKYWRQEISDDAALDGVVRLFNFAVAVSDPLDDCEKSLEKGGGDIR